MPVVDKIIVNGTVRTLDDQNRVASGLAIAGNKIVAIGDDDEIAALRSAGTETIDAGGRTVLPAFIDTHTHLRRAAIVMSLYIDFLEQRPTSLSEVLRAITARVERVEPGTWIQGDSLDFRRLSERRFPNRWELDSVAPRNPVLVRGIGRHVAAANSLALKLGGIDRETPDPPGGRLERDETGELTGILHEHGKLRLDTTRADTVVPIPSPQDRVRAMRDAMSALHTLGIACVHEMAREPDDVGDYLRLREEDGLTTRVRVYIRGLAAQTKLEYVLGLGMRTGFGDEWVRLGGVKFSIDGGESAHNAALYEEYPGEPGNTGLIRIQPGELTQAVCAADAGGLQVAVHAIGQRAVDIALDAFEEAARRHPGAKLRHRLEHAYLPLLPGQLERIGDLNLIWSTQPSFMYTGGEEWAEVFGEERAQTVLPLRSAAKLGITTQINSDYPCSSMNPFVGIRMAVSRRTEVGNVFGEQESIGVEDALKLMTVAGGSSTTDHAQGCIAPGKLADLIITDQDPCKVPPAELDGVGVVLTMVDGVCQFRRI